MISRSKSKKYFFEPLEIKLSDYPDFSSEKQYKFTSKFYPESTEVEIDIYSKISPAESMNVYMGIDIGSTSTKAIIISEDKEVIAGLYTRTIGRPVAVVQTIFEAITCMQEDLGIVFNFSGVGTTGSGRKFIGKIIGADTVLDEITPHARAAYELDILKQIRFSKVANLLFESYQLIEFVALFPLLIFHILLQTLFVFLNQLYPVL